MIPRVEPHDAEAIGGECRLSSLDNALVMGKERPLCPMSELGRHADSCR